MNRSEHRLQARGERIVLFVAGVFLLSSLVSVGTTAAQNTAFGTGALPNNTGTYNSAFGFFSLFNNTSGSQNTAIGALALLNNSIGSFNTAMGLYALVSNTGGFQNTAIGGETLASNGTGFENTATGFFALQRNDIGVQNTASGNEALFSNTSGSGNVATGDFAVGLNTTGGQNIAIGDFAGENILSGSGNIDIGTSGPIDESGVIRIGSLQDATFVAGIATTNVLGTPVEVASNGQLGITASSARYKRDIRDLGSASSSVMKLRPVSFRYKDDPTGTLQYGLVAEEVQRVYPELVTTGHDGKVQSVRYLEFTALLLNELQKQAKQTRELAQQLKNKDRQLASQQRELEELKRATRSISSLSERLAVLEQQSRMANAGPLRSLATK
jgi:hypothetical protein